MLLIHYFTVNIAKRIQQWPCHSLKVFLPWNFPCWINGTITFKFCLKTLWLSWARLIWTPWSRVSNTGPAVVGTMSSAYAYSSQLSNFMGLMSLRRSVSLILVPALLALFLLLGCLVQSWCDGFCFIISYFFLFGFYLLDACDFLMRQKENATGGEGKGQTLQGVREGTL